MHSLFFSLWFLFRLLSCRLLLLLLVWLGFITGCLLFDSWSRGDNRGSNSFFYWRRT
jgi:hypothetical protein